VYFAEDDYFYRDCVDEMIELIRNRRNVDFVTPYDHPDYYQDEIDPENLDFSLISITTVQRFFWKEALEDGLVNLLHFLNHKSYT
jgi:hypothetical protein